MVKVLQDTPDNIIGFRIAGEVESRDYEYIINPALNYHVKDQGEARLYIELVDFEGETFKALFEDIKTTVKHYGNFKKVGIAGKEDWIPGLVKAGNLLTPGVQVKHFGLKEKKKAMTWLK